jgi:hypothetical protein
MHPGGNNDCFETNSIDWVKQNEWLGYNDSLKSTTTTKTNNDAKPLNLEFCISQ